MLMDSLVASIIGLLGVAAGALLQNRLSRQILHETKTSEQEVKAYVDYLPGVAGVAQSQRHQDPEGILESLRRLTDAKTRILVYGKPMVVRAMATFDRLGGHLTAPEEQKAFASIIQAMRGEKIPRERLISDQDILRVIFNNDGKPA